MQVSEQLNHTTVPFTEPAEDHNIQNEDIVFLETSGRTGLKARDGCALESAALHHPHRSVVLYSISPTDPKDSYRMALRNVSKVKFQFLDLQELFRDTPLQEWHKSGQIHKSSYPIQHLSDAVRLAILWKYGGTYLDTDMIAIRTLGNLSNALGYGSGNAGNSALIFNKGHPFLYKCMEDYAGDYRKDAYDFHGPQLVTRALKRICSVNDLSKVINKPEMCQGITLLPDHSFYAFHWKNWTQLFEDSKAVDISHSYTVHLYAKMTAKKHGKPGDGSLLDMLTKTNCPTIYNLMVRNNTL